jgi:L-threonylcarbamoyladenylate synthase
LQQDITNAHQILKTGGIILYPTDTIWGIGCDATNPTAVKKIFQIKNRDSTKSFVLLVNSDAMLNRYVKEVPALAWDLIDLSDAPLTIVYENPVNLPPEVMAENGTVAIRLVKDEFCSKLITKLGKPIVSTSANFSNKNTPKNFSEVDSELFKLMDYIVKHKQNDNSKNKASSIISLKQNGEIKVIRK